MAKPFEIILKVEEIALGSVLRKLHETPGIIDIGMEMGLGGTGPGAGKLAAAAAANSKTVTERIVELLNASTEPMQVDDLAARLSGVKRSSINTTLYSLVKSKVVQRVAKQTYVITRRLPAPAAAAAPLTIPRGAKRAERGAVIPVMLSILAEAPDGVLAGSELNDRIEAAGGSRKSMTNMLARAIKAKLIKRTGNGNKRTVQLTEKGRHAIVQPQQMNGVAHHG